jgi:hypothetical protein
MDLGVFIMRYPRQDHLLNVATVMRYMQPGASQREPFRCGTTLEEHIRCCFAEADFFRVGKPLLMTRRHDRPLSCSLLCYRRRY